MKSVSRSVLTLALLFSVAAIAGCDDKEKAKPEGPPGVTPTPPPSSSGPSAAACANGGGALTDPVSAGFFPKTAGGYCVDPQGEIKTYGEKGKLSMDEVCTTAFDGECEVYKRYGLKRVVSLHYVDGSGKGGQVEVNLSQFADIGGAYGMFTLRTVAGDPAEPSTPKVLAAGGAGAIGTGRAYVWRGVHLVELQYVNENESPEQLTKSSEAILTTVGKDIGDKLPGAKDLPPPAAMLPAEHRVSQGITYAPKDVLGWSGAGPGAIGYYKDGDRRWRVLAIVKDDAEQAKDALKTMKSKPGSLPIANSGGDEGAHVVLPGNSDPKVEMFVVRKGNVIWGVGDEEYALRAATGADREKARLTKEEATSKMKPLLDIKVPAPAGSASSAPAASAAPKGSSAPTAAPPAPKKSDPSSL